MPGEGADIRHKIGELAGRHKETLDRAEKARRDLERHNEMLRQMLEEKRKGHSTILDHEDPLLG